MSNSSPKPPIINIRHPTILADPLLKEPGLSSQSSPQWPSGTLTPTSSVPSPVLPPEESIIQPGISIPIPDLPSPLEGTLKKTKRVGGGGYSDVYRGQWTPPNEEPVSVAIKCIRRVNLGADTEEQENQDRFERRIKREAVVWQTAKHENILEFCGFQIIDGEPMFVSPWCANGNLREYIKRNPELADVKKLELLRDAAQGLSHLHSLEPPIIHGDIKPDNVMVTNDIRGVLCDFGISRVMTSLGMHTGLTTAGQGAGTAGYQAKELYEEDSRPTPMSDVYAFGGVILATMSGKPPFHKKLPKAAAAIILAINQDHTANPADHPELPKSDPLWVLLKRSWDPQPARRPSVKEIIAEMSTSDVPVISVEDTTTPEIELSDTTPQQLVGPGESIIQPGIQIDDLDLPPPLEGKLTKIERIGVGGCSEVYRGIWTYGGKDVQVGIKCLSPRIRDMDDQELQLKHFQTRIRRETVIWGRARHKNILPFIGYRIGDGDSMLVSPWCEHGSLATYVSKHSELTDYEKLKLLCDAAEGIAHLHSLQPPVIHGDIKPDNVLVTGDLKPENVGNVSAALADFGISRLMVSLEMRTGLTTAGGAGGTAGYQAIELMVDDKAKPTDKSDAYSFGGLILATMSGKYPFYQKKTDSVIVLAVVGGKTPTPKDHPRLAPGDPLWNLMRKCWSLDPAQRPSMNEIIKEVLCC
ncbi:hypothetical protein FRC05_005107 [Tulasnella sp. 425]|nr:hypothetical protein FRC05_005107 [Tulasnella sp. 425]